jgi:hypothetical protein
MKDRIIILGIAPCLEEDLASVRDECLYDFMAIGLDCSDRIKFDIQHAATYHTVEFIQFAERRRAAGGNLDYKTHSHEATVPGSGPDGGIVLTVDYVWPLVDPSPFSGSSSFLGAQAAVGLGYKKIILCGCPMSGKNLITPSTHDYDNFQQGWMRHVNKLESKVRSMSGWTKEFLGFPDEEWLNKL